MVQGVKVQRATVRTTLTPWAATAGLCLVEGGRVGSPGEAAGSGFRLMPSGPTSRGRASARQHRAGRGQERGASRAGKLACRSGAQPGALKP